MVQRLSDLIHPSLIALKTQAAEQTQAEVIVKTLLPDSLKSQCRVSRFSQGCLTISVGDAVWLALIRYQLPALRDQLRRHPLFYGLRSIELDVQPGIHEMEKKAPVFVARPLSPSVRDLIFKTSQQMAYEPLALALKRLAEGK